MNTATSLLGLLFDHTIGNILRMLAVIRCLSWSVGRSPTGLWQRSSSLWATALSCCFRPAIPAAMRTTGMSTTSSARRRHCGAGPCGNAHHLKHQLSRPAVYERKLLHHYRCAAHRGAAQPEDTNGTYRWVYFAGGSFSLQPSELAKFSVMLWTLICWTATMPIKHRSGTDFSSPHCRLCRSLSCSSLSRTTRRSCCSARSSAR